MPDEPSERSVAYLYRWDAAIIFEIYAYFNTELSNFYSFFYAVYQISMSKEYIGQHISFIPSLIQLNNYYLQVEKRFTPNIKEGLFCCNGSSS